MSVIEIKVYKLTRHYGANDTEASRVVSTNGPDESRTTTVRFDFGDREPHVGDRVHGLIDGYAPIEIKRRNWRGADHWLEGEAVEELRPARGKP